MSIELAPDSVSSETSATTHIKRNEPILPIEVQIIRSTQYGELDRCREIIEKGFNINQRDNENCTLLHWASINNRLELVKYFVSKGAQINAIGGELLSTPLHWAVRQGHLRMTVLLIKSGADPNILDGEGFGVIHLAAQFGHTPIVAYLVAKGVNVDSRDKNGYTAIMWAAHKIYTLDPVQLLITLGADVNAKDVKGNTSLHLAVVQGNHTAVTLLLKNNCSVAARNEQNETPYDLAKKRQERWMILHLEKAAVQRGLAKSTFLQRLKYNEAFIYRFFVLLPFPALFSVGAIFQSSLSYLSKLIISAVTYGIFYLGYRTFSNEKTMMVLPLGVYLATKFWMYVTWYFMFMPFMSIGVIISFLFASAALIYNFGKTWLCDPGVVTSSLDQKLKSIVEISETDEEFNISTFCTTCLVRKPARSKHCAACDRCIAKFDHHCPWVGNCIGINNHRNFIAYLIFLFIMCGYCIHGCIVYWLYGCQGIDIDSVIYCAPWVSWIFVNAVVHISWVGLMMICQLYQVLCLSMTTNERLNAHRYTHFQVGGSRFHIRSPFTKGFCLNFVDFFNCFQNNTMQNQEWESALRKSTTSSTKSEENII